MPKNTLLKFALLTALVFTGIYLVRTADPVQTVQTAPPLRPAPPPPPVADEFGIMPGGLKTVDAKIARNATFSEILGEHDIPAETIHRLVSVAEPVFDVRRIRVGDPYRVYVKDGRARYLVYQSDAINYVVFDLSDSLQVSAGQREVAINVRTVYGKIDHSLYQTLTDIDVALYQNVAIQLSEVFAWQIDFYRLQEGDAFKLVYEEHTIDGEPVAIGDVIAARFDHDGFPYYAFHFGYDGHKDYFDAEGESLRKALLKSPLKFGRVSSGYNKRRFHPVQKRVKAHLGTDYAAPHGTPIRSTGDGVVLEAQYRKYNGNYVKIRHNDTYTTGYLHMSRIADGIKPGTRVQQGQTIGYVGSTGLATGPHVCYRFWKHGVQVDHRQEEMPSSNPVPAEHFAAFSAVRDQFMVMLDADFEPTPALASRAEASAAASI